MTLDLAPDPHTKSDEARVRVAVDDATVGFLTAAMTKRHAPRVQDAIASGVRATAAADVKRAHKDGTSSWQITLRLAMPSDTEVVLIPTWVANSKTKTSHVIGGQLSDGSWRATCGAQVPADLARVLCKTRPSGRLVDETTGNAIPWDTYSSCLKCS